MAPDTQRAAGAMRPQGRWPGSSAAGCPPRRRHLRAARPPVTYPGAVPPQVAEFSAAGKYEDFTRAVNALDGALGLSRPGSTRMLVIVSDGRCKGTQHADGQKLITRLAASGCLVIWIAPSDTANTMTRARVVILDDPAATSAAVARAVTVSARTA